MPERERIAARALAADGGRDGREFAVGGAVATRAATDLHDSDGVRRLMLFG